MGENEINEENLNGELKRQEILKYIQANLGDYTIVDYGLMHFPSSVEMETLEGEKGYVKIEKDGESTIILLDFSYDNNRTIKEVKEVGEIKEDGEIIDKSREEKEQSGDEKKYYLRNKEENELEVVSEDEDKYIQEMKKIPF